MKPPPSAEPRNASADNDDGDFFRSLRSGESRVVADAMAERETVVDELTLDTLFGSRGETDKSGSGYEKAASRRHLFSVALL